jgi:hypothetical protein
MTDTPPITKPFKIHRLLIGVIAILFTIAALWILAQLAFGLPGFVDFLFHRSRYQAIVTAVKALPPPPPSTQVSTKIQMLPVSYTRDPAGNYAISITTCDWGHAGCSGYLYSDGPFKPITGDPYTNIHAPGDLWTSSTQITAHWIVITCNLH